VTESRMDKYFKLCPSMSSRTYGSVWQRFDKLFLWNSLS